MIVVVGIMVMGLLAVVEGAGMNVMVPAYFDPSVNSAAWAALNSAAGSLPNRVVAVANPASGPGSAAQASYTSAIQALQAQTGRVIGYVDTNYGLRTLSSVEANIDSWFSFYPSINGIFFDQAANTNGKQAYYQNLYNYVKSKNSRSFVVTNPGTSTLESYLIYNQARVADIICILESNVGGTTWTQAPWTSNYDRSNFYGIFWNVTDINVSDFDYGDVIDHAYQQNTGWIYVTNDNDNNPYDSIASYFPGEVTYIAQDNYLPST